jgi:hypothetical protein
MDWDSVSVKQAGSQWAEGVPEGRGAVVRQPKNWRWISQHRRVRHHDRLLFGQQEYQLLRRQHDSSFGTGRLLRVCVAVARALPPVSLRVLRRRNGKCLRNRRRDAVRTSNKATTTKKTAARRRKKRMSRRTLHRF